MTPQITVPLIPLPEGAVAAESRTGAYRALIAAALKSGAVPPRMDLSGVERKSMPFSPLLQDKVQRVAEHQRMTFAEAFAGLTQAGLALVQQNKRRHMGSAAAVAPPFPDPRPEQAVFYQNIRATIAARRLILAEASTGVGKGRALVAAAFESALEGNVPVVVAAPTLKILGQLWGEAEELRADAVRSFMPGISGVKACFFPGAGEFVDVPRLRDHLAQLRAEGKDDASVRDWLDAGGPTSDASPLVRAMGQAQVPLCFLMEDLRRLASEFPAEDFAVHRSDAGEASQESLRAVRAEAARADVIFCTHAMLLRAHQGGWKVFPAPRILFVDEAHQFEQEVAKIHSSRVSLYSLRRRLLQGAGGKPGSKAAKAAKAVQALIQVLRQADFMETGRGVRLSPEIQVSDAGKAFSVALNVVGEHLSARRALRDVLYIQDDVQAITRACKAFGGESRELTFLEFSPDRRFPSLVVGRGSVGGVLGDLWKTVEAAVLCSATLFIPDEFGNKKCDYIADVLSLPFSRLDAPAPVRADWVTANPVMHLPSESLASLLARPQDKTDAAAEEAWIARLGSQLAPITDQARGGALILTTSYAQSALIRSRLLALGVAEDRLVQQRPNVKFAFAEAEFREKHRLGLRPILPALGVAWTGVDLRDQSVPPEEDTLLTDLAIACSPIGLNRSSTMLTRVERMSVNPIIKEALMMLRQGLGRIIRDGRMRDRNIWFLDGRVWTDWKGMRLYCLSVRRMLGEYKNVEIFDRYCEQG